MKTFKRFLGITLGLIFANIVHSSDQFLFPDNQFFDTGEYTKAVPIISCDTPAFHFSKVLEGHIIKHSYQIKNTGDAILYIIKVKTGCGCSTVSYAEEIHPGQTGDLVLKIDTDGYGGKLYKDVVHVMSNDPNTPDFELTASGPVEALASVSPKGVRFMGKSTDLHETIVRIEPNSNYSFQITGVELGKLKKKVSCTLAKQESVYVLTVRNQMKTPGRYWGKIVLNTDHQKKKQFDLWISANLK